MSPELEARIREKPVWRFRDCVGLASEFNLKPRAVIAMVHLCGCEYVDHEAKPDRKPDAKR